MDDEIHKFFDDHTSQASHVFLYLFFFQSQIMNSEGRCEKANPHRQNVETQLGLHYLHFTHPLWCDVNSISSQPIETCLLICQLTLGYDSQWSPFLLVAHVFWPVCLPGLWSLPLVAFPLPFLGAFFLQSLAGFHHFRDFCNNAYIAIACGALSSQKPVDHHLSQQQLPLPEAFFGRVLKPNFAHKFLHVLQNYLVPAFGDSDQAFQNPFSMKSKERENLIPFYKAPKTQGAHQFQFWQEAKNKFEPFSHINSLHEKTVYGRLACGIKVICKVRRLGGENGQFRHQMRNWE